MVIIFLGTNKSTKEIGHMGYSGEETILRVRMRM